MFRVGIRITSKRLLLCLIIISTKVIEQPVAEPLSCAEQNSPARRNYVISHGEIAAATPGGFRKALGPTASLFERVAANCVLQNPARDAGR